MLKSKIMLPVDSTKIEVDVYGIERVTHRFAAGNRTVVIVPGLTCKNWPNYLGVYEDLATVFSKEGFLCVTFASRGQYPSGGAWLHKNAVRDVDVILNFLYSQGATQDSLGLLGRSIGTSVALSYIVNRPHKVNSVALWGTAYRRLYDSFFGNMEAARRLMDPRRTVIDQSFLFTDEMLPEHLLPSVEHPLLLGYGTEDVYSTLEEQIGAFGMSQSHLSSFVAIKGATHEMDAKHSAFPIYAHTFVNWFDSTLKVSPTRAERRAADVKSLGD